MIFLTLFLTFFKIGAFTFGGGYAMLPLIKSEVIAHGWLTTEDILDFVAVAESTPGPFAVNIATYIGNQTAGLFGAFCATLGVVLPSFVIILIVAKCYLAFKQSKVVEGLMTGLRPTVVGLISSAAITMAATVFFPNGFALALTPALVASVLIFAAAVFCAFRKVHPIIIIVSSGIIGIILGYIGVWG